eukprot:526166-Rhodomonas_salina.1
MPSDTESGVADTTLGSLAKASKSNVGRGDESGKTTSMSMTARAAVRPAPAARRPHSTPLRSTSAARISMA